MDYAIKIENLTKQFMGLKALDDLSLEFPSGQTTGLIGPNGSGKTTLMNVLTGMLVPENGMIEINERRVRKIKPNTLRRLKIARTFQDGRLIEQLSVEDNLLLPVAENRYWHSLFEQHIERYRERLENVLQTVRLADYRYKNTEGLSYGQRKLLEIGRALMQNADIYFFDEPFTGLFPETVQDIVNILRELKQKGKTLIVIEHNMNLIEQLCDYTVVLDSGRLLAKGIPAEVLADEKVREAYLGK